MDETGWNFFFMGRSYLSDPLFLRETSTRTRQGVQADQTNTFMGSVKHKIRTKQWRHCLYLGAVLWAVCSRMDPLQPLTMNTAVWCPCTPKGVGKHLQPKNGTWQEYPRKISTNFNNFYPLKQPQLSLQDAFLSTLLSFENKWAVITLNFYIQSWVWVSELNILHPIFTSTHSRMVCAVKSSPGKLLSSTKTVRFVRKKRCFIFHGKLRLFSETKLIYALLL